MRSARIDRRGRGWRPRGRLAVIVLAVAAGAVPLTLTGCGRKAPNLPPDDSTYPRTYPAPQTPGAASPSPTPDRPAPETRDERRRRAAPAL